MSSSRLGRGPAPAQAPPPWRGRSFPTHTHAPLGLPPPPAARCRGSRRQYKRRGRSSRPLHRWTVRTRAGCGLGLRRRHASHLFRDFRKYFWGFFVLHVGGQIPQDLFDEIVARTFVGSFGLILSQISHGFGLDLEFSPKPTSS